jgi:hypothetical protein
VAGGEDTVNAARPGTVNGGRPCEGRVNTPGAARGPRPGRLPARIPQRAQAAEAQLLPEPVRVPRIGLELPRRLGFEAWLRIGTQLSAAVSSSAWCLGDWLVYGQVAFSGRYRDALEQTSLDYQTLRNYAWVARRFPVSRRRDNLSFGHHAETAALPKPEQDFWLRKAADQHWSRNQLRQEVRASLRERRTGTALAGAGQPSQPAHEHVPPPDETRPDDGPTADTCPQHGILITMTAGQLELCDRAAASHHLPLQAWAARTLNQAARQTLQTDQDARSVSD